MQAQCKQTPQEFIKNAFTPQIAVMYTPLAEKCCLKNNLDFIQLLQPFCTLTNDVSYKDPTGFTNTIRNLKLTFLDILWRPPQTHIARKLLNSSVSNASDCKNNFVQVGRHNLEVPSNTPWFESWRDTFLRVQYPSDHEFTKHFLACILVATSAENNLEEAFDSLTQRLNQAQSREPGKLPKWFNLNILKYFVILHDNVEGDTYIAEKVFDSVKLLYGVANCFLLKMNSRSSKTSTTEHLPDPWSQFISNTINIKDIKSNQDNSLMKTSLEIGQEAEEVKNISNYHPLSPVNEDLSTSGHISDDEKPENNATKEKSHGVCLTTDDVEQIKLLIYEFSRSCLMPYIEKQIHSLNDTVSNKKGVSKSLFSATKRWFSPNKPGASSVAVNNLIYSLDSPELQIRRLGDLYFMFGQYSLAFQAYHLAKRDYNADQAWLYYAGALEMAALAAFMANDTTKKTCDYMEESITTYLNTCKMPQFATRATILSSVCLVSQNMFGEAAHQLIRMTSEESDLRSALLLEQASYCFLKSKMVRKYAFHMVLAGHRYSKAAQRKYSLKCYKQAYQVYENTGWDLASDHIHYTIGRQANNLQHFDEAIESFAKLLKGESKQTAQQQATFLKEYLTILGNKLKTENEDYQISCPILPVPDLEVNSLKILLGPTRPLSTPGKVPAMGINFYNSEDPQAENKWIKLEEMLVHEAEGAAPLIFKPVVTLYNEISLEKTKPVAVVNEPIQISIKLVNSLQTVLNLTNIHLLWTFQKDKIVTNTCDTENGRYVKTHTTKSLLVEGNSKKEVVLSITPLLQGVVTVTGFSYTLTSSNGASGTSSIKGKQLIRITDGNAKNACNNFNDSSTVKPLDIDVVPPAPCLQVTFSEINSDFLADELQKVLINFQNTGSVPLKNIYMASSTPHLLCNCEFIQQVDENLNMSVGNLCIPAIREKIIRKNHLTAVPLTRNILKPGQTVQIYVWVKAPSTKGPAAIDILIYYENVDKNSIPKYRLVRHNWNLMVQESIVVDVSFQSSHNAKSVEELALAMKITNLNKVHSSVLTEVMLLNVGLLSKYWTLTEDIATPKYINLHSQESAHILLKAKRSVQETSKYSSVPLNADRKSIQSMTTTFLAFAKKAENPTLTMFDDFDSLKFKENNDGVLLLQWQALVSEGTNKQIVIGQTSIPIEINRKEDTVQMERILSDTFIDTNDKNSEEGTVQITQKQIVYNLIYSPVVKHNFIKRKICIVPVKILLHSTVDNKILSVIVNTTEPSVKIPAITNSNMFCSYGSSNFCWISNSKIVKILNPLTTATVQLAAALSGPGTFDLGAHIQVLCKYIDHPDPYILQTYQIHPTLIIVFKI
ncbi:trafficking protein particle complex subunit 8 [Diorhabda sublineata]|uniref:trafficking protein particle complex subunit 8 n=1 Tax=Diorhabda sublineata TaxID=1163346 RepID=UPI0024E15919|nr:trafficking protein particle complex subunit 8 [Diorhabda sublineata]